MARFESMPVFQGEAGGRITLEAGESAILNFSGGAVDWRGSGCSWTILPAARGEEPEVQVESSVLALGDAWSEDPRSPMDADRNSQGRDRNIISRKRFTAIGSVGAVIDVACAGEFDVDTT